MKKFFALFLSLTMLICSAVFVNAENGTDSSDVKITYDSSSVKLGKEFGLTVSVTNSQSESFIGGEFALEYDNALLELVSVSTDFEDLCPWTVETLYSTEGYIYLSPWADLSNVSDSDVSSCGVASGETIDFIFTFKCIGAGNANVSVTDVIFLMGEFFKDVDLEGAEASVSILYPAKISGVSLLVGSGIKLAFTGIVPDEYKGAEMYFATELTDGNKTTLEDPEAVSGTATGVVEQYNGNHPQYQYIKGVNPDRLGDDILAYLVYDGVVISETKAYSVLKYCNFVFTYKKSFVPTYTDEQYAALETLLCDLLEYGSAAQKYTNYNPDSLVKDKVISNYTLVSSEFKTVESTDFNLVESTVKDPKISGISLSLGSNFWLSYTVNASSIENIKIKVAVNTGEAMYYYYLEPDFLVKGEDKDTYYLNLKPAARGIDYIYTVTLYDANGNEGRTLSYSAKSYVYTMQNDTTALGEVVRMLYNYGKSAEKYAAITE